MSGRICKLMVDDHLRVGALLESARQGNRESYDAFRGALLRHIGIEEKILLPALRALGHTPAHVAQLRLDHSALAAMLVPSPTPELLSKIITLLAIHDPLEEAPDGVYPLADRTLSDVDELIGRIERSPVPPLAAHFDGARAFTAIEALLTRAMKARAGT